MGNPRILYFGKHMCIAAVSCNECGGFDHSRTCWSLLAFSLFGLTDGNRNVNFINRGTKILTPIWRILLFMRLNTEFELSFLC